VRHGRREQDKDNRRADSLRRGQAGRAGARRLAPRPGGIHQREIRLPQYALGHFRTAKRDMLDNPVGDDELGKRLAAVRQEMQARDLEVALLSTPENIFYLTGLDHWGYFAPHLLIVPIEGEMILVTRQMERVSIQKQVRNALFHGHADNETAADLTVRLLRDSRVAKDRSRAALKTVVEEVADLTSHAARVGVETWSSGHSYGFGNALRESLNDIHWVDITGMVDDLRLVKSEAEQALMRKAAAVSDA